VVIQLPDRERLPPGPHRDLVVAMHGLYDDAGKPGSRLISAEIRRNNDLRETVSHETISATLRGRSIPAWGKIRSIVIQLVAMSDEQRDMKHVLADLRQLWLAIPPAVPKHLQPTPAADAFLSPVTSPIADVVFPPTEREASVASGDRVHGELPERNPYFTGREILLDHMSERLIEQRRSGPMVLYGLGGAGKTQLAREYIEQHLDTYAVIWWIPATRAASALTELAERLQVPAQRNADQTIDNVIRRLESGGVRFLLVFDGVEDDRVRRYFPTIGGNIVVTTRDPAWANDSTHLALEVPDFDRAEAIQFLRKRFPALSGEEADGLASAHGRLPLALEQIAALKLATGMSWEQLLHRLDDPGRGLLATGQPAHYPHTVAALLQLALDQLDATNPVAVGVFELFAFLGSGPVSVTLLSVDRDAGLSAEIVRTMRHPLALRKVVQQIGRFGLARLDQQTQRIEVQPLMRLALRNALSPQARDRARRNVHAILAAADPGWPDHLASRDMHREIAAHVVPSGLIDSSMPAARQTVLHQVRYRYLIGEYESAVTLAARAVTRWSANPSLGADHDLVLLCSREWANVLRAIGRYQEASRLTADTMPRLRDKVAYGPDHPETLALATSYAADLRIAGEYRAAYEQDEDTYRRYLRSPAHGEQHPLTSAALHNLSVSCRHLGRFAEAEVKDRLELRRHLSRHGVERAKTLLTVNALAEDLYGLGRFQEVLDLHREYSEPARRVLGPAHRGVLLAARTVALARLGLGDVAQALNSLRDNYHDCITSFGAVHEYTLAATMSYANCLRRQGRQEQLHEAFVLATDAVGNYQRAFGARNPLTLVAEVNRAAILRARGEHLRAREADAVAYEALHDIVGDEHPYAIAALANLATDLARAGDAMGARDRSAQAYRIAARVRGEAHPDTLQIGANLVLDMHATGDVAASEQLLQRVLGHLRRSLGPTHPTVAEVASGRRMHCTVEPPST